MSPEDAATFLKQHGIDADPSIELPDPREADGTIGIKMVGRVDRHLLRGVAKISFNYFAHQYPDIARLDQCLARYVPLPERVLFLLRRPEVVAGYRGIRRYIRFDEEPEINPVSIIPEPFIGGIWAEKELLAHVITTRWDNHSHRTAAQVSLFGWLQYQVVLSSDRFVLPPSIIDSGHLFNPAAKQVVALTRNRHLAAKNLPLMTKQEFRVWQAEHGQRKP